MAEDCTKRLEIRRYERKGEVTLYHDIERKPRKAPAPRKTKAQIVSELTKIVDDQIKARNNDLDPNCGDCDSLGRQPTGKKTKERYIKLIWKEKFQLKKDGKLIEGVAKYMASATVKIQIRYYELICDEFFGSDPSEFEIEDFDHDKPTELEGYSDEQIEEYEKHLMEKLEKYSKIDPVNPVKEPEEKKRKKKKSKKGK